MSLPKPAWPSAPERGSYESLRAEYLATRARADQAIADLNAGRPTYDALPAVKAFVRAYWRLCVYSFLIGMVIGWIIRFAR